MTKLYILSAYKTKKQLCPYKDLLVQHPPTEGNVHRLFSRLMYDSLSLKVKAYFPVFFHCSVIPLAADQPVCKAYGE